MDKLKVFLALILVAAVLAGCAAGSVAISTDSSEFINEVTTDKATADHTDNTKDVVQVVADSTDATADDKTESSNPSEQPTSSSDKKPGDNKKPGNNKKPQKLEPGQKYVAFTFDDGPHWELTKKFADKLAEYDGVGTFFVVGNRIYGDQQEGMKYAYDLGNEIGVHAWTHDYYYNTCSEETFYSELSMTASKIQEVTGEYPLTMRPVGGGITDERIASSGFAVINWSVDTNDWQYASGGYDGVSAIYSNVVDYVGDKDIILFHEIYYNSYDAFCQVIDELHSQGYKFVTVSQLLQLDESHRGTYYTSGY